MSGESILLIGSGGREHAMATALAQSPQVAHLYSSPGNAGLAQCGELVDLNLSRHDDVNQFVTEKAIRLVAIGPEAPLVDGLADSLRGQGHLVVGVNKETARLEGSKIFAKNFMRKHGIPTAAFNVFENPRDALEFAQSAEGDKFRVLKADGLAAGKGVIVTSSREEMIAALHTMMVGAKFGHAGKRILLEEKLDGPEVSVMGLSDGKTFLAFPAAQDHKRAFDGDQGPNTGGMGAYAPTPFYEEPIRTQVEKNIVANFLKGIQSENLDFRGIIYFGLMITTKGPVVLEFNVRLGDPEAQVLLPLMDTDLYAAFKACAEGNLTAVSFARKKGAACTVVLTSGGYPGSFAKGFPITGLEEVALEKDILVYHAGTKKVGDHILTHGGRVLDVTALGTTLEKAVHRAYAGVKKIKFEKAAYRADIASKALKRMKGSYVQETAPL